MLVTLASLLKHAKDNQYAVAAFNISFQEQAQAVLDAAHETQSPVIIQLSRGGLKHASPWFLEGLIEAIKSSPLPICLHRDHCHTLDEVEEAIQLGFSSIMMDGSLTADGMPNSLEENIQITQEAMRLVQGKAISIEAEIGCLGSLETGLSGEEDGTQAKERLSVSQLLTDPKEAQCFVKNTHVHALAVAIGTSHGAYKFSSPPSEDVLNIQRVQEIHQVIPNTPLVLHGSSSVPKHLLDGINHHGGDIPQTYGVPVAAIQQAIGFGVAKVNIDTDLRLACTLAVRETLQNTPSEFDPRSYLKLAYSYMKQVCTERYIAFGSKGQAKHIIGEQHETHYA